MLDGEVVFVPHLFRFLRAADVFVVHVGGDGMGFHLGLVEHVIESDFHLAHADLPPDDAGIVERVAGS